MLHDATASLDAAADLGATGIARYAAFLNPAVTDSLPFPLTTTGNLFAFEPNSQPDYGLYTSSGALFPLLFPVYTDTNLAAVGTETVRGNATVDAVADLGTSAGVIRGGVAPDDGQGDLNATAVAQRNAVVAADAQADLTAVAVAIRTATMSGDGSTDASFTAIASVPDDANLDAASEFVASAQVLHPAQSAQDATTNLTGAGKMAFAAFLVTAQTIETGFPPSINGVPLPYLQGATITDWVTVAGTVLPALYVNYLDGGLLLAAGGVIKPAQAAVDATSNAVCDALNMVNGTATLSADTDIQTGALWEGVATLYAAADLTALPAVTRFGTAAGSASTTLAADAQCLHDALGVLAAETDLDADSIALVPDSVYLHALGAVEATAITEHAAAADLATDTDLAGQGSADVPAFSSCAASADLRPAATVGYRAQFAGLASGTMVSSAIVLHVAAAQSSAVSACTVAGARIYQSALSPDGAGDLAAFAGVIFTDDADLIAESVLLSDAMAEVPAFGTASGDSGFDAVPDVIGAPPLLVVPATLGRINALPLLASQMTNPVLVAVDPDQRPEHQTVLVLLPRQPVLKLISAIPTLVALKE